MSTGSLRDMKDSVPVAKVRKKHSEGDLLDYMNCSESQWLQYDEVDALPTTLRFNFFDIFCIILSMCTYIFDLGMDIYVAYVYYTKGHIGFFVLTLVFVIIPAGTMTAFSLRWYVMDMDNQTIPKPSCTKWVIRIVFLLLQLAPVLRYMDALMYGLKSRKAATRNDKAQQVKYYTYMINEDADSTLLRLFEAFMESAPQVTLQLYILIKHYETPTVEGPFNDRYIQFIAVGSSLLSLAWSLSAYNRSLRFSQPEKPNITYRGTIVQFFWHLCAISARVFALAAFAATYDLLLIPVCVLHWLAMLVWLIVQGNQACSNQCDEALFNLVVAFIYVFTFFNIRDEPTRYKYLTFYIISFFENTVLLLTWFFPFTGVSTTDILWFRVAGLVGDYALFFMGILCMVIYYTYFHPSVGFLARQADDLVKENSQGSNQQSSAGVHAESVVPKKPLTRKGSIDHSALASFPQSASSSRKNVTFSLDHPSNTERLPSASANTITSSHGGSEKNLSGSQVKPNAGPNEKLNDETSL
ncbi:unnamed protein product [Orchesella dallaii]|uniref:XK-related protein n=1 Tax=Orchesella dallaii TaxID=48710 RepID=A0ABP1Q2I3_9HEXA